MYELNQCSCGNQSVVFLRGVWHCYECYISMASSEQMDEGE